MSVPSPAVTPKTLLDLKRKQERFTCLTAYDASFAALLDEAGVEVLLVGDSLGMVIQGQESTVPVSMDDMVYHTRLVKRGTRRALLMADMPFMSYTTPAQALANAARLMQEGGAQMVKLEASAPLLEVVGALASHGVPVCAHLGLAPQAVYKLGGYRVQGREQSAARAMLADAKALQEAGADLLLLECVPAALAAEITASVAIPVIGIGAGPECDGQVLVLYDMLGVTPGKRPRFSKDFSAEGVGVRGAVEAFVRAVKEGRFPGSAHTFE